MPKQITEAAAAPAAASPGRIQVGLITPGWGSSGYYSPQVLESAAADKVWPKGTHIFFDHPGEAEMYDRPERSVRDLAAVLTEDASWDGTQLSAPADVIGPYRDLVTDPVFVEAVGMSIRASAEQTAGEAEGRKGMIIDRLVEGISVDLVTRAGRGGKVLAVLESSRAEESRRIVSEARNVGQWIESRLHLNLTQIGDDMFGDGRITREERIALSGAVGDGLTAFAASLEQSAPQLYERDLWDEPAAIAAAEKAKRPAATDPTNIPSLVGTHVSAPAGRSNATESKENTMATTQIEEAELGRLREDSQRVQTAESARDAAVAERDSSRAELATYQAREAARPAIAQRVGESTLPARRQARIVEAVIAGITGDNADPERVAAATEAAVKDAEADMAEIAEALGAGRVRGLGSGTNSGDVSEADYRAAMYGTEQKGA